MKVKDKEKYKIGKSVLARSAVICIAAAIIWSSMISGLAAQQPSDTVTVTVNAPAYVETAFNATIDVNNLTKFNSAQFDLSFDASVVNVTDVADGCLDGETIPVDRWEFVDNATIRVILDVSGIAGVNGSGYLAKIHFEVVGATGDKSVLDISDGLLVDTEAEEIPAEWADDEVTIGPIPVKVSVKAPEYVEGTFDATIDVNNLTNFYAGIFDLSFDPSVVSVTGVANGSLGGETIPVDRWERVDNNTIRIFLAVPEVTGISGFGNLATISFAVVGKTGDKNVLGISNGLLGNTDAEVIPAEWIDDEVTVGP